MVWWNAALDDVVVALRHNLSLFRSLRHFTYEKSHRILRKHTLKRLQLHNIEILVTRA